MGVEQARAKLGPLVDDAAIEGTVTYLTKHGRRYAAIVPLNRISADVGRGADPERCAQNVPANGE